MSVPKSGTNLTLLPNLLPNAVGRAGSKTDEKRLDTRKPPIDRGVLGCAGTDQDGSERISSAVLSQRASDHLHGTSAAHGAPTIYLQQWLMNPHCHPHNPKVVGSNPTPATIRPSDFLPMCRRSTLTQSDQALGVSLAFLESQSPSDLASW